MAGKITIIALIGSLWAVGEVGSIHRNIRKCGCRVRRGGGVLSRDGNVGHHHVGKNTCRIYYCKGVYPQSDGSLAIVDIDALKGFVDLWVHLSFANFDIFYVKRPLKLLEMAYDQVQTCLIFPL